MVDGMGMVMDAQYYFRVNARRDALELMFNAVIDAEIARDPNWEAGKPHRKAFALGNDEVDYWWEAIGKGEARMSFNNYYCQGAFTFYPALGH